MKTIKFFFMIATLCIFVPSFALAGGGIEPGDSCGLEGVKYVPPPLMGEVIFTMDKNSDLIAFGILERPGKNGCVVVVIIKLGAITVQEFNMLTAKDIKNWCLDEIMGIEDNCTELSDDQPYEVVAVGGFKRLDPAENGYSARLIIMPLQ